MSLAALALVVGVLATVGMTRETDEGAPALLTSEWSSAAIPGAAIRASSRALMVTNGP